MSSPKDAAKAFTIAGLLDESAATRKRFPIEEIEVSDIEDHPGNAVYSMDVPQWMRSLYGQWPAEA